LIGQHTYSTESADEPELDADPPPQGVKVARRNTKLQVNRPRNKAA